MPIGTANLGNLVGCGPDSGPREEVVMSEQTFGRAGGSADDVGEAGSTDEDAGNLTVEDDTEGTTDPGDLAGSGDAGDEGVR